MSLDPREPEVFRAVMETGGVAAAATGPGMTQPAASRMLRQAGCPGFALFRRERKPLVPTPGAPALRPEPLGAFAATGGPGQRRHGGLGGGGGGDDAGPAGAAAAATW